MSLVTNVIRGSDGDRLLVLLHGYGSDERDLGALLPHLDPTGRFVAVMPRAPFDAPGAPGYAWFPITEAGVDTEGFVAALDLLDTFIDEQCTELGLARDAAIFGGFSQGAGLALLLALRAGASTRPAGVLAMSPFAPAGDAIADPLGGRRERAGIAPTRHRRPDDPRERGASPLGGAGRTRCAVGVARIPDGPPGGPRKCAGRRGRGSIRSQPASDRRRSCPNRRPKGRWPG